tara:strand:+ start:1250 stop:2716 length:1467 start_codon:yes stop_codon:yes gene_type:complete
MTKVFVEKCDQYPSFGLYSPSESFPEYNMGDISQEDNRVYKSIREILYKMGYDSENYNTEKWNPLGFLIKPGMKVIIKPNFVLSRHYEGKEYYSIVTHPSVLRAILDYCVIALEGQGSCWIADAPQYNCNFEELKEKTNIHKVVEYVNSNTTADVQLVDLRDYWSAGKHFPSLKQDLKGDPKGSQIVELNEISELYDKCNHKKLYGAVYDRNETISNHNGKTHRYCVSKSILDADVVISVPKMKIHKKVGVTLNAKNLVGINTNKNYLVHYTLTPPSKGGDQYPDNLLKPHEKFLISLERWMYDHLLAPDIRILEYIHRSIYWLHNNTTKKLGFKVKEEKRWQDAGNWYGNDSCWRMTVDLMKILFYSDVDGKITKQKQRKTFSFIDGVIGGDGRGPLDPDPVDSKMIIASECLLSCDIATSRLMGIDPLKIKTNVNLMYNEFDFGVRDIQEVQIISNDNKIANCLTSKENICRFKPHPGWIGKIEIQ